MKAHVLSRRNRAVGFAIAVSIIMLGAAALASAGAALAPMSPPGGASASSTTTTLPASFAGSSSGQTYTVSLVGSSVAVGSFPSPTPSQAAQGSAASAGSSFLEPFASDLTISVAPTSEGPYDVGEAAGTLTATLDFTGSGTVAVEWWSSTTSATCGDSSYADTGTSGLTLIPDTSASGATYYCAIATETGGLGSIADSNSVDIIVNADPAVSVTPVGPLTYDVGQSASPGLTATVDYSGPNTVAVEWWASTSSSTCGDMSYTDTAISGDSFTPNTAASGTTYYCAIATETGGAGTVADSNSVEITVNADPTVSVAPVGPLTYDVGQSASPGLTATVTYSGSNTVSVEWWSSTSSAVCGDLSYTDTGTSGLTLVPDTSAPGTTYYCAIATETGGAGTVADSNSVEITVNADPTVSVTPTGPLSYDVGQTAGTLTASVAYLGSNTVSVEWYSSGISTCNAGSTDTTHSGLTFTPSTVSTGTTYYCAVVSDSGVPGYSSPSNALGVTVNPALVAGGVTPDSPTYDVGQTATLAVNPSAGTSPYSYQWYSSAAGTGACDLGVSISGATDSTYGAPTGSAGTTYYCYVVTDSATTPTSIGSTWDKVTVNSALVAGGVTPGTPAYDVGQTATLTSHPSLGTIPYTYQWYSSAAGTGACDLGASISGATDSTYGAPTGSAGTTYYCYVVTDSASTPTSIGSGWDLVTVNQALAAGAVTPGSPTYDVGQTATLASHASSGTGSYTYQWYSSATGSGACDAGTSISGATGNTYGAPTGSAGTTYYCYVVTDSATTPTSAESAWDLVTVNQALAAGAVTPGSPTYDVGQTATLTSHASLGTTSYSYQWYSSTTGAGICSSGSPITGATNSAFGPPTGSAGTTYYCYVVTDSASTPTSIGSGWDLVTVNQALAAGAVTPGSPTYDVGQTATLTSHPSLGTIPYTYQWYSSATGSVACNAGTSISGATGNTYGAPTGSAGTTYYCYVVTDSATTPTSIGSTWDKVTVNSALAKPGAPTPSATTMDADQPLWVNGTIPLTGTSPYSWQWLVEVDGAGGYAPTTQCVVNGGTGAAGGTLETCWIPGNTLTASTFYNFELKVTDAATAPVTVTSTTSAAVTTSSALTAGTPSPAFAILDNGQSVTLTANPSGGSIPYTNYTWYSTVSSATAATTCGSGGWGTWVQFGPSATYLTSPTSTSYYCYVVTDTNFDTAASATADVAVNSTLTAPTSPTVTATALDVDQALTATTTLPSTGTPDYSWQWLVSVNGGAYGNATQCAGNNGTGADAGDTETCAIAANTLAVGATYAFELQLTDNATLPETTTSLPSSTVTVSSALTAPAAPTPSGTKLDVNQVLTVTGKTPTSGSPTYTWQWLISINGAAYSAASQCSVNGGAGAVGGATETCRIVASTLAVGDTYSFELMVTDSADSQETATSLASSMVAVSSALTSPGAPSASATALDADQALTVTGKLPSTGTPTYAWQWLISVNGGAYVDATQCLVNSGSGASVGATETCTVAGNLLTAGATYSFELKVTDSASTPQMQASLASATVTVSSALSGPATPAVSATALDVDQVLTVTGAIPSTGTSPYSWQWMVSVNGGAYADATQCVVNNGSGASGGAPETCSIVASTLIAKDTYTFQLQVTDSASTPEVTTSTAGPTVVVRSALTAPGAPAVSSTALDVNQVFKGTAVVPSTGTSPYSWQWLISINGTAYTDAKQCAVESGGGATGGATVTCSIEANVLIVGATYTLELRVTDSASTPETMPSLVSLTVTVSPALTAVPPTPTSPAIDSGQSITLSANPSGGSGAYTYQWYSGSTATACLALGSPITTGTSATYSASPTTTTYYCYAVTDSATMPETQPSSGSLPVTVNSALTAPSAPAVSATSLNVNQALTMTATIPLTGTPTYSWQWLVSVNGGGYAPATQCAANGGSGATGGTTETCSISANTLTVGDTYGFELRVTDSATSPSTQTSSATSAVTVTSPPSSSLPTWVIYVGIALGLVVIVLVLGAVGMRRRRPRPGASPPMQAWQEEPTPPSGVGTAGPAYLETPEDIGHVPPGGFTVSPGGTASVATVPPAAEAEPDIDVLMSELDRISVDILNKTTKKGKGGQGEEPPGEDDTSS
ncbi:MAG: hypothetical protein WB984_01420 [Thermoplasmata archaeon]